jgi:hypothetical protein
MHFHQRRTTQNPRNLRGLRANTQSSQTLQKKMRVRARRRLPAARIVVDYHSIYYQNLYPALTFTMDTDTGGEHRSSHYVDVVVRNTVTLCIVTCSQSEIPARTAESAARIVFALFRFLQLSPSFSSSSALTYTYDPPSCRPRPYNSNPMAWRTQEVRSRPRRFTSLLAPRQSRQQLIKTSVCGFQS